MAYKFPRPDYLTNEEVDYELMIRGREEEINDGLDVKQRLLRKLFYEDVRENKNYRGKCTIDQEFDYIMNKIENIAEQLEDGHDERCMSRLKHYALRVERSIARNPRGEQLRNRLGGEIRKLQNKFGSTRGSEDRHTKTDEENEKEKENQDTGNVDVLEEEIGAVGGEEVQEDENDDPKNNLDDLGKQVGLQNPSELAERKQQHEKRKLKKITGTTPKVSPQGKEKEEETEKLRKRIVELEKELYRVAQIAQEKVNDQLRKGDSEVGGQQNKGMGKTGESEKSKKK